MRGMVLALHFQSLDIGLMPFPSTSAAGRLLPPCMPCAPVPALGCAAQNVCPETSPRPPGDYPTPAESLTIPSFPPFPSDGSRSAAHLSAQEPLHPTARTGAI